MLVCLEVRVWGACTVRFWLVVQVVLHVLLLKPLIIFAGRCEECCFIVDSATI